MPRDLTGCALAVLIVLTASGCAIHYFDSETGTEHVWGLGHMAMKAGAPAEGLKAVGLRTDVVGLSLGKLQEGVHLAVGWNARQQIEILDGNSKLCLAWPRSSAFYQARIGSEFPTTLDECGGAGGGKNP